ncbi:papilin isoform X3 [Drosophila teissieri]|uniref:papilin isoform X3 n=1 Tax=Drosophila teissieri TaxID=7243 RepID=UPI001CBA24E1|nr:papilin isoform X3 [Drosophila teissieri]
MGAKQTLTEGVVLGLGSIKRIGTWPTITSKLLFPANRQTMPAQITLKVSRGSSEPQESNPFRLFQLLLLLLISKWALGQSDCSDCSSTNGQYACVNETAYGFCFDQGTVDEDAVQNCRDGYYCVLEGFCAPMASAEPACITVTSTSTTDIVTDSSTDSTTSEMTTESITDSTTSELTTESTSDSTTSETTTESSTDSTTSELTTDSSTDSTTTTAETTSDSSTDSSTSELTTESSTDSTTSELTTDSSTDSTTSATSTDSSTQTTVPSEIDPNAYCAKLKSKGYFRVENDTTCQMYVYCYKLSLDYLGWLYYCNTNEYYNSDTEACQSTRPSNC